jgi:hypothetical protein
MKWRRGSTPGSGSSRHRYASSNCCKPPQPPKKTEVSIVRSSAAEYLTFVAVSGQGGVEAVYAEENVWITQKMLGVLYNVNVR